MKSQKVISEVFEMFTETDNNRSMKFPFKQDGYYCASDACSAIRIPENLIDLPYQEQDSPHISKVIPTDLHEPIEIDVNKLESEIKRLTPMVDERVECRNCEGRGDIECNMGHDHDCTECDGEGGVELTGKKIPNESTVFNLFEIKFAYPQLDRLVKASKLMGVEKIYKVFGTERKPSLFEVGEATILVAPVVGDNEAEKIEL